MSAMERITKAAHLIMLILSARIQLFRAVAEVTFHCLTEILGEKDDAIPQTFSKSCYG